jgi:hypothetical protein
VTLWIGDDAGGASRRDQRHVAPGRCSGHRTAGRQRSQAVQLSKAKEAPLVEVPMRGFGDGIMSAIDFDMTIERLPGPKSDRVKIGRSGKFLPFNTTAPPATSRRMGKEE